MMWNSPQLIFIHIPKTGGVSLEHLLYRVPHFREREGLMGQHAALQTAYGLYGDVIFDYKLFTVMRNTYHRILSLYCFYYMKNGGNGGAFVRMKIKNDRNSFCSFPDFYNGLLRCYREKEYAVYAEDFMYYCGVNGKIPDNLEVLDFDNIESDFTKLWCDKWNFELPMRFPHKNGNEGVPIDSTLRKYLIKDPAYLAAVEEIYADEIQRFGYTPY